MASRYGLEIRAATAADAAGLAALFQASGQSIAASDLAERLDSLRLGSGTALIAVEWGPPSGLVVLHWYRSLTAAQPVAQITGLLVGPDERRRGIGRLLLKAASQAARMAGCATLELAASADEESLRAFCARTGFEPAGSLFTRPLRKKG
ncbi:MULTISPECIES: GNAT family N-acetyltransferase [unclassified Methylobacterium]|uniref:GNAT family N-acetyltransferase n=1 Tax=unclassified Methylobacterium TaxID=2615210 RepID=UPI0006F9E93D|nr:MULTISPECIES: GNAT family N-acetyltransferase [unclassified Methylobacterium]KQO58259.1 GCN5 family acetyltransferase [Methylobacterium sp. Leaf86]KQO93702.1 GCN5 family acetyltransferase [Methylobacterium sp. Leaf91]